jgi:heptosyltransferase-2
VFALRYHCPLHVGICYRTAPGRALRQHRFDVGLIFPNSIRSALELWLARVPQRIGYARPWRSWLLTRPVPPRVGSIPMRKRTDAEVAQRIASNAARDIIPATAHHVRDYLGLVAELGASPEPLPPSIYVTNDELADARERFGIGIGAAPWFGLNPGAEYGPAKRWPAECFIAAAVELHRKTQCRWVLFGGPGDVSATEFIAREIVKRCGADVAVNVAGKTSLRQLAAAFKLCSALLTNDTGPMHLASAVGVPVVVPFGSTSPEMTGPVFASNARILAGQAPCAPCFRRECPVGFRCLTSIEPSLAVEAMTQAAR